MENKQSNLQNGIGANHTMTNKSGSAGKTNVGSNTMGVSPDANLADDEPKGAHGSKMDVGPKTHTVTPDPNLAGAAPKGGGKSSVGSNTMGTSPDSNLQNGIGANHTMTNKVFGQTPANLAEKTLTNIKGFERFINEDYKKK